MHIRQIGQENEVSPLFFLKNIAFMENALDSAIDYSKKKFIIILKSVGRLVSIVHT